MPPEGGSRISWLASVAHRTPYSLFLEVEAVQGRPEKEFMERGRLGGRLRVVALCRADDSVSTTRRPPGVRFGVASRQGSASDSM